MLRLAPVTFGDRYGARPSNVENGAMRRLRRSIRWTLALANLGVVVACGTSEPTERARDEAPLPRDSARLFPVDRGKEDPGTPGIYKGLPLRLTDNGAPPVTPVDGVIGLVCVGMSNGNHECADFEQRAQAEFADQIDPAVRVVNCAVPGHAIERWNDPTEDADLWDRCIAQRLPAAGVRLDQVRVLWHKAANQFTTALDGEPLPTYPAPGSDYEAFMRNLSTFASRLRSKFPALQAVYTSSRSYGGFAEDPSRGELLSYEEGHALNQWLVSNPSVDGIWHGWGGYLWAPACATGITNGSGVCYGREDYIADGVHPSTSGRAKISRILHARFGEHAWYRRP